MTFVADSAIIIAKKLTIGIAFWKYMKFLRGEAESICSLVTRGNLS